MLPSEFKINKNGIEEGALKLTLINLWENCGVRAIKLFLS